VSPLSLRRYRAERLLRRDFETLRSRVIAAVDRRLRACGTELDRCDLEAAYAAAWQGLYMTTLAGGEIDSPAAWLVLVTFRRAVEERRARTRVHRDGQRTPLDACDESSGRGAPSAFAPQPDLATALDDRVRLRQLFEGLRGRLSGREREAAVLCYLHGLSRSEAAARMGVSEARMRKLMEGRGPGSPGVAGKVGALVASIRDGDWCEEQGSLMRALAFGVLEPRGERHRLALAHALGCPACRSYVASLRGLAAVLPPVLAPWGLAAASLVRSGELAHGGVSAAGAVPPVAAGAPGGGGIASGWSGGLGGVVSTPAAAGAGAAAGGSWLLAGGALGGKLALGCLLALGVGAGCVVIDGRLAIPAPSHRRPAPAARAGYGRALRAEGAAYLMAHAAGGRPHSAPASLPGTAASALTSAALASHEFGPEQQLAAGARRSAGVVSSSALAPRRLASAASSGAEGVDGGKRGTSASPASGAPTATPGGSRFPSTSASAAAREFAPG
jgi:DNA-directed RNA polymerase specialized sigma24 family protein